jgi:hypothetical protein
MKQGETMQIAHAKMQCLPTTVLIVMVAFVWVFMTSGAIASYPATYAQSAHGDPTSGVNRSGTECPTGTPCPQGDCTHCHETFAPSICGVNELMLFAPNNPTSQTDNFCFQCHRDPDSAAQSEMIENKDYGSTFGGGTANSTNIKDAFALGKPVGTWDDGSSHNLLFIRNWVSTKAPGDWITESTNACALCHHVHYSQKNHDPYPGFPPYKTAIRRPQAPSSGVNKPWNLWGDETGSFELMGLWSDGEYTNLYQAPERVGGGYEPAGQSSPTDGSNLPNFVTFCTACHGVQIPTADHDAPVEDGRNLSAIDWTQTGDKHGKLTGDGSPFGMKKWPYSQEDPSYNYVLACTDCHEPHGSPSPFLLRTSVNGTDNITVTVGANGELYMYNFCLACHTLDLPHQTWHPETEDCSSGGVCHAHGKAPMF